ncbi:MAG: FAD-dependent oxidoreductase [Candidatus Geothermarchaeales archaeon]
MTDGRIERHPVLEFKRGRKIHFSYDGKKRVAYEGETIASALYAEGVRIFSRSLKYHRPRGMFCGIGKCSNCLMTVNGIPNVRTCIVPVEEGMVVESQNAFPSASHDIYSIIDKLPIDLRPGFFYEKFTRPRFVRDVYLRFVRRLSGIGKFPEKEASTKRRTKIRAGETDVGIVGGGPAGLSAAISAARYGVKVTLIDENHALGGQLLKQTHRFFGSAKHGAGVRGIRIAEEIIDELQKYENIEVLLKATVFGVYEEKVLGVMRENELIKLKAKKMIVTTGAYERTLIFENNDLPGVYGAGGVQTLMNVHGVKPGDNALMIGAGNVGLIISYQLLQAGVDVRGVVEAMPRIGGYAVHAAKIRRMGVPILTSHTIKKALGRRKVEGARIIRLDEDFNEIPGTERDLECDLICISVGLKPTYELLFQAGCEVRFIPELGGYAPLRDKYLETTAEGVYVAGDVSGIEEASTAVMEGRITGISAALSLGKGDEGAERLREEIISELREMRSSPFGEKIRLGLEKALFDR